MVCIKPSKWVWSFRFCFKCESSLCWFLKFLSIFKNFLSLWEIQICRINFEFLILSKFHHANLASESHILFYLTCIAAGILKGCKTSVLELQIRFQRLMLHFVWLRSAVSKPYEFIEKKNLKSAMESKIILLHCICSFQRNISNTNPLH